MAAMKSFSKSQILENYVQSADIEAYLWATAEQGFTGSYEDFLDMPDADRQEYDDGAQGIGTA